MLKIGNTPSNKIYRGKKLMENSQMKNIVVLKNLPSNMIEEAIVILKSKKSAREFQYIDKDTKTIKQKDSKDKKDFIIKEAESVISNYIDSSEKNNKKKENSTIKKKYKRLKIYSVLISVAFIIAICI